MHRRTVLASAGAGLTASLSGCITSLVAGDDGFTVVNIQQFDDPEPLALDVEIVEDRMTADRLPILEITVENTGDEVVSVPQPGNFPESAILHNVCEPADLGVTKKIWPLDGEDTDRERFGRDGCVITSQVVIPLGRFSHDFEPGEIMTAEFRIFGNKAEDGLDGDCPETGTYQVEKRYHDEKTWGFEFDLV